MTRTKSKPTQIRFLRDRPADQDFFGTHKSLAKAVASALVSNPELRTIGLLGKWGSGKSTVLGELDRSIDSNPELSDIRTFTGWDSTGDHGLPLIVLGAGYSSRIRVRFGEVPSALRVARVPYFCLAKRSASALVAHSERSDESLLRN